jgi:hypothetical protein
MATHNHKNNRQDAPAAHHYAYFAILGPP